MKSSERLVLPDIWRGVALLLMIAFHTVFLGWFLLNWPIDVFSGFWFWIAKISGYSFLIVAGWSSWLRQNAGSQKSLRSAFVRSGHIAAWAGVITLTTLWAFPTEPIWWGILHCLAVALLISNVLLWYKKSQVLVVLGVFTLLTGIFTAGTTGNWLTMIFGFPPLNFRTLDYYPLIPYAGMVWLSAGLGATLTQKLEPLEKPLAGHWLGKSLLLWLGQHSLSVYIGHVPIVLLLLWLTTLI